MTPNEELLRELEIKMRCTDCGRDDLGATRRLMELLALFTRIRTQRPRLWAEIKDFAKSTSNQS